MLEVKGLTFDSTLSTVKFNDASPITITDGSSTTYGKVEVLNALTNGSAKPGVDGSGNLAVTVAPVNAAKAVTGTVAVRITNNAGNIVFVGTINVDILGNQAPAAPEKSAITVAPSLTTAGKTSVNVASTLEYRITDSTGRIEKQIWTTGTGSAEDSVETVVIGDIIEVRVKAVDTPGSEVPEGAVYKHSIGAVDIKAAAAPNIASEAATNTSGATKLTGLEENVVYEYVLDDISTLGGDDPSWSTASTLTGDVSTVKDDFVVNGKTYIHIRVKATTTLPASEVKDISITTK